MASFPTWKLYQSDGTTIVYEFECVVNTDYNKDPANFVEHQALRGKGSIIIPGSESAWDLPLSFVLIGIGANSQEKYESLSAQINTLKATILKFTKYILKVEITQGGSTNDYKVQRTATMTFPNTGNRKRINIQEVNITLRVDSWS